MRPEANWHYRVRTIITGDEFAAWLVSILGTVALTLATILMGLR